MSMLDGSRRSAIAFAITILLAPSTTFAAGTDSNNQSRQVIADEMSAPGHARSDIFGEGGTPGVTQQAREQAADIFESRCVACHGAEGRGDGPAASNLNPKPRDFHNPQWQKSISDETIARAIIYGGQSVGVSGEMASNPDLEDEPAVVAALVERIRQCSR
jgi:mono/diheme cytochrome c family protein